MPPSTTIRSLLATLLFTAACGAQSAPTQKPDAPPCPPATATSDKDAAKPCTPPASETKKPSVAEQFPFPGESVKPEPDASAPNAPHPSAATEHPFPTQPAADADSSSSSSSSSSDDADSPKTPIGPPLHDEGSEGKSTRHRIRAEKSQTDDQRVDEDLRVAKFYSDSGNLQGAYLRAKDAVKIQPDYSETRFALAQIAQKMKKKDEAIAEYKAYLSLDPNGERKKAVVKALGELE
jgi:hypothetical protein